MKGVIFAGGLGSRLGEETGVIPKPMVPIGNHPILWHIMSIYAHYGYREFVICLGHRGDVIKRYFRDFYILNNDYTVEYSRPDSLTCHTDCIHERDWKITLVDTGQDSLKGARLKIVEPYLTDTFFLTYGDGVADIDIGELIRFHRQHGKAVTITGVHPPSRFGEIICDGERVVTFTEKPQASEGLINGGFMVLEKAILDELTREPDCDFEIGPLENLAAEGEVMVYRHPGQWECMDTPRDRDHLNKLWRQGEAFWKAWD